MTDYSAILSAATQLTVDERLRLIGDLSDSIPEGEVRLSAEWLEEIERRSAEIDAGTVELEDWSTVRERLFRRVGLVCDSSDPLPSAGRAREGGEAGTSEA